MIAIGIVAHTSRAEAAKRLQQEVRAEFISIDNGTMGCDDNHHHVQHHLAALPSTWSVILEDDAEPIQGFRSQLHQALTMAPSPVVSLYLGRKRPPHWQKRIATAIAHAENDEANWIVATHLLHAVGYAIKTHLLPSLLNYISDRPIDEHITGWAKRFGHTISYTYPSLVDHADWPTIVEHPDGQTRRPGRVAWEVGSNDVWTSRSVPLQ